MKNEEFIYNETSTFEIETNQVMRLGISEIQSNIFCHVIQEESNEFNEETKHAIDELDFDF